MSIRITIQADSADDTRTVSVLAIALKDFLHHLGCSVGVVDEHHTLMEESVVEGSKLLPGDRSAQRQRLFAAVMQGLRMAIWCVPEAREAFDDWPQDRPSRHPRRCEIARRQTTGNLCAHRSPEDCSFPGVCRPQPRVGG